MGIAVEFNPDLALRDYSEFVAGRRKRAECLPAKITAGKVYNFLKSGQRNYWFFGELPLLRTRGNANLSRPLASIKILEATHIIIDDEIWTKGKYKVLEVFDELSREIHFESYAKIGERK